MNKVLGSLLLGLTIALAAAPDVAAQRKPQLRAEYYRQQRAFPFANIPQGAVSAARREAFSRFGSRLTFGAVASAKASGWSSMGPQRIKPRFESYIASGRIPAIAVHPTNSSTIYVGGAQGGVWKTTNGGSSWTSLTDDQCALSNGNIIIDPTSPNTVYVGTGELNGGGLGAGYYGCGILKSTDGGSSWTQMGAGVFDPAGREGARVSRLALSGTALLSASDFGLHRSTDGGSTWTQIQAGTFTDLIVDPGNASVVWAAEQYNGVLKSTDGGVSFTRSGTGFPTADAVDRINLALSAADPNTVYAAVVDPNNSEELLGIYKTTDGGGSWSQTGNTPACAQCFYDLAFAAHPTDANTVYFGGVGLYKSTDGGDSFQEISSTGGDPIHVDHHFITFDPQNANTMFVGNDGGIYKSTDAGTTWTTLNTNLSLTQFYPGVSPNPNDANSAIGGTQDNGTLRTDGVFAQWDEIECGDGGYTAWDRTNNGTIYATCQWSKDSEFTGPMKSTNGGGSFDMANTGISVSDEALFIPPLVMDPTTSTTLYFGTNRLYQTTDGASNWTALTGDLTNGGAVSAIAPAPSDGNTVYVGTADGNVHVVTNGSAQSINVGVPTRFVTDFAVHPTNANEVYLTVSGFGSGHVFRSTDRGAGWQDISGNLPDMPVNAVLLEPGNTQTIYVGTDLGIYVSDNSGGSWAPFNEGMPLVGVMELKAEANTGVLIAATHGRGIYKATFTAALTLKVVPDSRSATAAGGSTTAVTDSATITLDGTGASTTAWTATHGGGAWLSVTTPSGTGSGTVRWSRDPTGLQPGTYVDTVVVTAAGVADGPEAVIDSFTITGEKLAMAVTPTSRSAAAQVGATGALADSAGVAFTGVGAASAAWTATHGGAAWLTLTAASGSGDGNVTWSRDPTGLAVGTYVDTITVTATGATGSPAQIIDTLSITAQALALAVNPSSASGTAVQGSSTAISDSATVTITGTGADSLAWTAAHGGGAWLTLTNGSGTGSGMVSWSRNPTGLAEGTYVDTVTVTATGATGSPAQIIDTFTITGTALALSVTPDTRSATAQSGSTTTSSDSATVTLSGSGAAAAAWTVSGGGASWLTLAATGGTGSGMVHWTRDPTGLAAGTYVDTLTVTAAGATGSPATVVDTYTITAAPTSMTVAPTSRRGVAVAGFTESMADSVTVTFDGADAASVAWTATHGGGAWVTVTTSSGTGSGAVRWSRDPTGLAAGTYVDTVTIAASGVTGSPVMVVDTFAVSAEVALDAAVTHLINGGGGLSAEQAAALDALGNNDGTFNLGDVLAWLDRCNSSNSGGCISSAQAIQRAMSLKIGAEELTDPEPIRLERRPS